MCPLMQVQFLYEDVLLERLSAAFEERLQGSNTSRVFYGNTLVAGMETYHFTLSHVILYALLI